jgi:hypothetical protein
VVHRWLQRIAEDALKGWDARRIDGLKPRFASELQRQGVPADALKATVEDVAMALKRSVEDERGRWILGPHPEAHDEYRIRVSTPSGTRSFRMDRLFRDAQGARWIVDYKTSRHEGGDLEAFLDQQLERYASQLESYAAAVPGSRGGLYFPLVPGWRELSRSGKGKS